MGRGACPVLARSLTRVPRHFSWGRRIWTSDTDGKMKRKTYIVPIRVHTPWVVSVEDDDLDKWFEMNALDCNDELTVKLAVELFTGLNGDVGFASASAVPLIEMSGALVTLIAGIEAPVAEMMPE